MVKWFRVLSDFLASHRILLLCQILYAVSNPRVSPHHQPLCFIYSRSTTADGWMGALQNEIERFISITLVGQFDCVPLFASILNSSRNSNHILSKGNRRISSQLPKVNRVPKKATDIPVSTFGHWSTAVSFIWRIIIFAVIGTLQGMNNEANECAASPKLAQENISWTIGATDKSVSNWISCLEWLARLFL